MLGTRQQKERKINDTRIERSSIRP